MKAGVLADIHGNRTALEAVINDCSKRGITKYILLGDLFAKGSDPEGVFTILKGLDIIASVRGNTDEWFLINSSTERQKQFIKYALMCMSKESLKYINQMKLSYNEKLCGYNILFIHNKEEAKRIDKIDIILTGHTHRALSEIKKNAKIFNPGSIGNPYDSNNCASYGILELEDKLDFEIIRVSYDIQKEKSIAIDRKIPYLEQYIYSIEYGYKYD